MWNFKFKSSRHYPMGCRWTNCSVDFYNYSKFLLFSNHTEIRIVCSTISQFCTPDPSLVLKIFCFLFVCGKKSIMFLFYFLGLYCNIMYSTFLNVSVRYQQYKYTPPKFRVYNQIKAPKILGHIGEKNKL